ncbi:Uncharacterized protein APZ42_031093 [Daphnia magna]|uniref:Uncharacterized protein n=1 Tax=Daphnia magna TaxID=35525 RepID=A0A164N5B0_9CRUS|nr:Uncharacterized protein APZ42_031093 [Daphnia magna]
MFSDNSSDDEVLSDVVEAMTLGSQHSKKWKKGKSSQDSHQQPSTSSFDFNTEQQSVAPSNTQKSDLPLSQLAPVSPTNGGRPFLKENISFLDPGVHSESTDNADDNVDMESYKTNYQKFIQLYKSSGSTGAI